MNIETFKKKLHDTKLMSLIKNKIDKQRDLKQFKNGLHKLTNLDLILLGIGTVITIAIVYTSSSIVILPSVMMVWSIFLILILETNKYKEKKYEKKLDMNSLLEEIKKEFTNMTTQKIIIEYINALAITYPEFQTVSKNIKKALIENNHDEASHCLELILKKEDEMIKNALIIMKEQENINKYEKELGVEIFANAKMNNKEIEKGWSRIL